MAGTPSTTDTIIRFINEIGIPCSEQALGENTFLPGIEISHGSIFYDPALMKHPGDLLHEAGHLAVLLPQGRQQTNGSDNLSGDIGEGGAEMAAIAWSWAALKHLGLAPEVVFHPNGYNGGGDSIIDNFSKRNYFGVPLLSYFGMCHDPIGDNDKLAYPNMAHWLRQENAVIEDVVATV